MGRKRTPGLTKRGGVWHIDKQVRGYGRLCESTGTGSLPRAEEYLRERVEAIRRRQVSGRPDLRWHEAAAKYLVDNQHRASIINRSYYLESLHPFIGNLRLQEVHDDTLAPFVQDWRNLGKRTRTINLVLSLVRRILNLCARSWRLPSGVTWMESAPKISMVEPPDGVSDAAKPYPLDWDEQDRLIRLLPKHLARMALYKVNTGCRDKEVCGLKWAWEWHTDIPSLKGRIFIIPATEMLPGDRRVKNREDRLVILNDIAKSVVEAQRGLNPDYVFPYLGKPITGMTNTAWNRAWKEAGLPTSRAYLRGVHNLKHTFGRRLRAAGVPMETRKVLLGHTNGDITTHYSVPEIEELLTAANKVCERSSRKTPALTVVRIKAVNE